MFVVTFKFSLAGELYNLHLFPFSLFPEISKIRCNFLKNVCNFLNALIIASSTQSTLTKIRYENSDTELIWHYHSRGYPFLVGNFKSFQIISCIVVQPLSVENKTPAKNMILYSNTGSSGNLSYLITTEMQTFALIADGENKKREDGS